MTPDHALGRSGGQSVPTSRRSRQPETPEARHARRVAWGREWGAVAREHSKLIREREGR